MKRWIAAVAVALAAFAAPTIASAAKIHDGYTHAGSISPSAATSKVGHAKPSGAIKLTNSRLKRVHGVTCRARSMVAGSRALRSPVVISSRTFSKRTTTPRGHDTRPAAAGRRISLVGSSTRKGQRSGSRSALALDLNGVAAVLSRTAGHHDARWRLVDADVDADADADGDADAAR